MAGARFLHTLPQLLFKNSAFAWRVCTCADTQMHTLHAKTQFLNRSCGRVCKNRPPERLGASPGAPGISPRVPWEPPEPHRELPGPPQECPVSLRTPPGSSRGLPKSAPGASGSPPGTPGVPQERPKRPQDLPRPPQETPNINVNICRYRYILGSTEDASLRLPFRNNRGSD